MRDWILLGVVVASLCVGASGSLEELEDQCDDECIGDAYVCEAGQCSCARGYILHPDDDACVTCPRFGQQCFGVCCSNSRDPVQCWRGTCQRCYDRQGNWICNYDDPILLISATQVAMGMALVLGILATFVLLYRLCAAPDVSTFGRPSHPEARLSVGSLQLYVDQRLRDAPPRYSRAPREPAGALLPTLPLHGYLNAGFIHDNSVPPPPYSGPLKDEEPANSTLHM